MFVFRENLACFIFLKHSFWDSPFELNALTTPLFLLTKKINVWVFDKVQFHIDFCSALRFLKKRSKLLQKPTFRDTHDQWHFLQLY